MKGSTDGSCHMDVTYRLGGDKSPRQESLPCNGCLGSGGETRTPNLRINSPLLCRIELPRKVFADGANGAQDTRRQPQLPCRHLASLNVGQSLIMKFRTGLAVGLGVGFILGARAGRERYDQMKAALEAVRDNEKVQRATAVADRSTVKIRRAAGEGLVTASEKIKERAEGNGSGSTP